MIITTRDAFLVLQETAMHPHSVVLALQTRFEKPSIIRVFSQEGLRQYTTPPIYDKKYLVVFEDVKTMNSNLSYVHLEFMQPVIVCRGKSMVDEAIEVLQKKECPYALYVNKFQKKDARALIRDLATTQVTQDFCDTLIRRVGLSPQRIISAIMVCEQVGYTTANLSKYVDKYTYIEVYDVIASLLGTCKSAAQRKRAAMYIHMNRIWYWKFTRPRLIKEVELLIKVYTDLISGALTPFNLLDYVEAERIPRYRVMFAIDYFEHISIVELQMLRQFLTTATILEVAMRLS